MLKVSHHVYICVSLARKSQALLSKGSTIFPISILLIKYVPAVVVVASPSAALSSALTGVVLSAAVVAFSCSATAADSLLTSDVAVASASPLAASPSSPESSSFLIRFGAEAELR